MSADAVVRVEFTRAPYNSGVLFEGRFPINVIALANGVSRDRYRKIVEIRSLFRARMIEGPRFDNTLLKKLPFSFAPRVSLREQLILPTICIRKLLTRVALHLRRLNLIE